MDAFRVEHGKYGNGPYAGPEREDACCDDLDCGECDEFYDLEAFTSFLCDDAEGDLHPTPRMDGMHTWDFDGRIFGFQSLDQLWAWFGRYKQDLEDYGYIVVKYSNVTDFILGNRQMCFRPTTGPETV